MFKGEFGFDIPVYSIEVGGQSVDILNPPSSSGSSNSTVMRMRRRRRRGVLLASGSERVSEFSQTTAFGADESQLPDRLLAVVVDDTVHLSKATWVMNPT
jgi:hypothetical protein